MDSLPDAVIIVGKDGIILECNLQTVELLGYTSKKELVGKDSFEILAKKDRERAREDVKKLLRQGVIENIEYTCVKRDGNELSVELSSRVIKDSNTSKLIIIGRNITEKKKMYNELNMRSQLLDAATDIITLYDLDGKYVYVNEAASRLRGYSKDDLLKMNIRDMIAPQYSPSFESHTKELIEKGDLLFQSIIACKDGSKVPTEVHSRIIEFEGRKFILNVTRDITGRKAAEDRLKESEEKYRALVENYPNIIGILQDGILRYVNDAACKMTGWKYEELTSPSFNPIETAISPKFREIIKENIIRRMKGEAIPPYEIKIA